MRTAARLVMDEIARNSASVSRRGSGFAAASTVFDRVFATDHTVPVGFPPTMQAQASKAIEALRPHV